MKNHSNDTFITKKVTNNDIYNEIMNMKKVHEEQFAQIIKRQDTTNGKVKLNRWIATTAFTTALIAIGYLMQHLNNLK